MLGPNEHTLAWLGIDWSVLGQKIPTFYPKVMWNCKVFFQQSNIFSFAGNSAIANFRNFHRQFKTFPCFVAGVHKATVEITTAVPVVIVRRFHGWREKHVGRADGDSSSLTCFRQHEEQVVESAEETIQHNPGTDL